MYSKTAIVLVLFFASAVLSTVYAEPVNCPGTIDETSSGEVYCNGVLVQQNPASGIGTDVTQTITSSAVVRRDRVSSSSYHEETVGHSFFTETGIQFNRIRFVYTLDSIAYSIRRILHRGLGPYESYTMISGGLCVTYTPGRRGVIGVGHDVNRIVAMNLSSPCSPGRMEKIQAGSCCRAVHGQHEQQTDVERVDEGDERNIVDVLTFVRTDLPQDADDGERLVRYLKDMEECIECQEEQGMLVVSKKTTLKALPSTYLKDLSTLLRKAKYNIKPLFRKISGDGGHPPCMGSGEEVLLQGFNWDSSKHHRGWYQELKDQVDEIADYGFTLVWLPPPTDSVSPEGYMPRDLYSLNSKYGSIHELMDIISMFQSSGVKVLGDAVINHRCAHEQNEHGVWNQFGGGMKWDERAVVKDDPNFHGKGNLSSGALFEAAPNIDHSQDFVKSDIGEWLVWLRTHVGFDGWRFDFVKGFHGSHLKDYLEVSKPYFSVGEFWDTLQYDGHGKLDRNQDAHRQRIVDWIHTTNKLSCAFDMTTKGILHAVFGESDYARLVDSTGKPAGFMGFWPSRAVTFLENHDTGSSQGHWRFPHDALEQGYAYILTHPGTPCVFYDHIFHNEHLKHVVRRLIALRKDVGIHCRSEVEIWHCNTDLYVARIEGVLVLKLGPRDFSPDTEKYKIVDRGHRWAIWRRLPDTDESVL